MNGIIELSVTECRKEKNNFNIKYSKIIDSELILTQNTLQEVEYLQRNSHYLK